VNYQGTRQRSALSPGTQINNSRFRCLPPVRTADAIAAAFALRVFPLAGTDIDPVVLALLNFKSDQFGK